MTIRRPATASSGHYGLYLFLAGVISFSREHAVNDGDKYFVKIKASYC